MDIFTTVLTVWRLDIIVQEQAKAKVLSHAIVDIQSRAYAHAAIAGYMGAADVGSVVLRVSGKQFRAEGPPRREREREIRTETEIVEVERVLWGISAIDNKLQVGYRGAPAKTDVSVQEISPLHAERRSHGCLEVVVLIHVISAQRHVET